MNHSDSRSELASNDRPRQFATTHWSMVLAAGQQDAPDSRAALERLCELYWYPLYAFARRQGYDAHDAGDLTQGFLTDLLRREDLGRVRRERGKFRSFLLASLKHYILNQIDRQRAQKRGGGRKLISFDVQAADSRFRLEPWHEHTAELDYERRWATVVLEQVRHKLRQEYADAGKLPLFEVLEPFLTGKDTNAPTYRETGERLEMSEGAVKVAIHRLRQKFRQLLRAEIANTVATESDIDDEIKALFNALRAKPS